jgi:leucyl/phenylalanyl-tRNA--protein transferase
MAEKGQIQWYTADPRAILPLDRFHIPRRLVRELRRRAYTFTRDRCFETVMRACAARESTWISEEMICCYAELHRLGHAHSVETWDGGELAGGLYGVQIGGAFFGESMFTRRPAASKAALVHLVEHLHRQGFALLEIQMITPLTSQFGPELVSRERYVRLLRHALALRCRWQEEGNAQ